MSKYYNPNQHDVSIDLGRPVHRSITLVAVTRKVVPNGLHGVISMSDAKAAQFVQMGMLRMCKDQGLAATFDYEAAEEQALRMLGARSNRLGADPAAAAAMDVRRAKTEADRKAKEAADMAIESRRNASKENLRNMVENTLRSDRGVPMSKVIERVQEVGHMNERAAANFVEGIAGEIDAGARTDQTVSDHEEAPAPDVLSRFKPSTE